MLKDEAAEFAGADSEASKRGALKVDPAGWDCCAWRSETVPAIRKLNAATRHAISRKLRLVFIFLTTPLLMQSAFEVANPIQVKLLCRSFRSEERRVGTEGGCR